MFKEYNEKYPPYELKKVSGKQIKADRAAVFALIEGAGRDAAERRLRLKPFVIAATAVVTLSLLLVTANAAVSGKLVKFLLGGSEINGEFTDYVDEDGVRHFSFDAQLPINESNYAIIFDIDAPDEDRVRVITDENDPDFMARLRRYCEALDKARKSASGDENDGSGKYTPPAPEEFLITFRDSELCEYSLSVLSGADTEADTATADTSGVFLGGKFMHGENSGDKPSGSMVEYIYDNENELKTVRCTFYYYVGNEE